MSSSKGAAAGSGAGAGAPKSSAMEKMKAGSKAGFDKGWSWFEKLGAPVNKITNKIGSEAFWPTELDKESDKAARILKSFCKDGFYKDPDPTSQAEKKNAHDGPKGKAKVLVKIPKKVIQNCVGLAIFTTMRTGLWISGAGGSGVLVAKTEDGRWSPPSGILIHTAGIGFLAGIDIYDCVIVINNRKALDAFTRVRLTLGGELSAVVGPVGIGGVAESEIMNRSNKPLFTYMKSRGLYGGAQIDGTIIIERNDENARFYGKRVPASEILSGNVVGYPAATHGLIEVLKSAEGRTDVDQGVLQGMEGQMAPSDVGVEQPGRVPNQEEKAYYGTENLPDYTPPMGPPPDHGLAHGQTSGVVPVNYGDVKYA